MGFGDVDGMGFRHIIVELDSIVSSSRGGEGLANQHGGAKMETSRHGGSASNGGVCKDILGNVDGGRWPGEDRIVKFEVNEIIGVGDREINVFHDGIGFSVGTVVKEMTDVRGVEMHCCSDRVG